MEKEMAIHSSILAWKIPWMEEPCRLQSMGSQSRTQLSDFTHLNIFKIQINNISDCNFFNKVHTSTYIKIMKIVTSCESANVSSTVKLTTLLC